jgi:membrane-bound ClpP family serine protease
MIPFILLGVGLLLIFLEFFLPGGIMGMLGALVVVGSIIVFAMQQDSLLLVLLYAAGSIALVVLLFRFALWRLRYGSGAKSFYSEDSQHGYTASTFDRSVIGKLGVVDTDLRPGGHVIVEEQRHTAISVSGYINKGEKVKVIGGQGESLTVKLYKGD